MTALVVAFALLGSSSPLVRGQAGGEIAGTVVAAATGAPIRGAAVSLSADDGGSLVTESDDEGRFRFAQLSAGRYQLFARQPGFLDVMYGQKRPGAGAPGVAIRLADGQREQRLVLAMPRGGAISGVLFDSFGDPAFGASVTVLRYMWASNGRSLTEAVTALCDERGVYRIPVLSPGEYVIKASPPESAKTEAASSAPIYYPGVTSVSDASVVTLGLSEERSGINVVLRRVPTRRVSGTVVDSNGRPPTRPLMVALEEAGAGTSAANTGTQVIEGKFAFTELGPGRYTIRVLAGSDVQAWPADAANVLKDGGPDDGPAVSAEAEVTVLERDVTDIRLVLGPGGSISGRVTMDEVSRFSDLSTVRVSITPAQSTAIWRPPLSAPIDARGGFMIAGVPPGRYTFSIDGASIDLRLRSALVGQGDVLDFPIDVTPMAAITDAVLTLTDRATELSGTLSDSTGQPTSDYMVVVFAADSRYWTLPSRRTVAMRPASDGRYAFRDLPAGDYRLAAISDAEPGQWFDARFLREFGRRLDRGSFGSGRTSHAGCPDKVARHNQPSRRVAGVAERAWISARARHRR